MTLRRSQIQEIIRGHDLKATGVESVMRVIEELPLYIGKHD